MSDSRSKLRGWLSTYGHSQSLLARRLGLSRQAVSSWFRDEDPKRPDEWARVAIQRMTGGEVTTEGWLTEDERSRLSDTRERILGEASA